MSFARHLRSLVLVAAVAPTAAAGADLLGYPAPAVAEPVGETVTVEPFVGYLRGTSNETVYDVAANNRKLSHLAWNVDAVAVGGRVAARPLDWLTVRGRFWSTVASSGTMTDLDWLAGYYGPSSWTHKSSHPDTSLGQAWQADASVAAKFYEDDAIAFTAIAGFRHYDVKYNARGGSFLYSTNALRDTYGTFTPGQIGVSYQQEWSTPYIGVGAAYSGEDVSLTAELIGSPFVMSRARDHHALRATVFKDDLDMSAMIGGSFGAEYRLSPLLSLAGRLDYQKYFEARGDTKIAIPSQGLVAAVPKPSSGADAETLLLSVGVKARL